MRTVLDTSTGYGTARVIDVKSGRDKYAISSAVLFLKELRNTRFRCRTDPEPAIKAMVDAVIKCQMIALSGKSCQKRQFPRVMRVWALRRVGTIFCKDKFERCGSTSKIDLGQSLVLLISACRGL